MKLTLAIAAMLVLAAIAAATRETGSAEEASSALVPKVMRDAILDPLSGHTGDPERGRRIVLDQERGNCLACHKLPEPAPFQGNLGPDLGGVGSRLTSGQIRLRLIDQSRLNPATLMPPYYRIDGLARVASTHRGRPILSADEIEDVVAYLARLTQ